MITKKLKNRTVLVVDDNEIVLETVSEMLELFGATVVRALDGDEALRAVERQAPDVVLCDTCMPRLSGLDVLLRLRSLTATSHLPFVLYSASEETRLREQCLEAGGDAFVHKVGDCSELVPVLASVIEKHGAGPAA